MTEARKTEHPLHLHRLSPRGRLQSILPSHDCVLALRALGEDTRVRIVGLLIDEALDVGEISRRLGVSPYNVSKHLRILREAGLLQVEKHGRTRLYALPEKIRGSAERGSMLDLGCCTFQFQGAARDVSGLGQGEQESRRAAEPRRRLSNRG
jgi:DNA-binding transcriptional ArsR family regulator